MLARPNQCRNFSLMHPRDRLVEIMQRIYDYSMTNRLEVAERAAQTVLYSLSLGKIVPLNSEQVGDLERKFPVN